MRRAGRYNAARYPSAPPRNDMVKSRTAEPEDWRGMIWTGEKRSRNCVTKTGMVELQ